MAQCARGHGVGVEGCIPQGHLPGRVFGGKRMWLRKKSSGVREMHKPLPSPVQTAADKLKGGGGEETTAFQGGGVGPERSGDSPVPSGEARVQMFLWPSRQCRADWGPSVLADVGREKTSSTSMPTPPLPPSAGTSSICRLRIAAHWMGTVASVLGKRKAAGPARLVGAAARAAVSCRVGGGLVGSGAPAVRWVGCVVA